MDDKERHKLNEATIEVFGIMYFTPIELLPDIPEQKKWNLDSIYVKTVVGYTGSHQANLVFYFPGKLANTIAEGFLGLDKQELTESQVIDTMREAANMIVGNFLGRLDPDGKCALGIPVAEMISDFWPDQDLGGEVMTFISDYGYVWLYFDR